MDRNRRQFLALASGAGFAAMLPQAATAAGATAPVKLQPLVKIGAFKRYTAVVEVEGVLRMNPDGKKVTTTPIKVLANLNFDEKLLATAQSQPTRVVRHYTDANAAIKIDQTGLKNQVREDFRTLCIEVGEESSTAYSPLGPLFRDELELLKLPGDPVTWNALLPKTAVKPGDEWKPADTTLAMLLGIDVVTSNEVTAKFVQADGKLAMMELSGTVAGAIGGVASDIDLKGKYNFDLAQKQVTWVALGIKEKRAIGHAEPGYEITSRVRIGAAPLSASPHLAESYLKQFPLELKEGSTLLAHESQEGGFHLLHDRRWHVMADHREAAILRLVDRGDLIAQCNISRLRNMPVDKQLTLEAFQKEVSTTLAATLEQVLDSDQSTTDSGLRQLRVVAAGTVQEVPVQWVYYHLSDDQGRNAALVFTMDSRLVERFAELDRAMVGSIVLRSRSIDAAPPEGADTASEENPQEAPAEQAAEKPATTTTK